MNAKKFARLSITLTLVLLILVAVVQITIDPLFQYHQPWFGLKPVVTDERYQNAGIAKDFDYENENRRRHRRHEARNGRAQGRARRSGR